MKNLTILALLLAAINPLFAQITLSTTDMPVAPTVLYNGVDTMPVGVAIGPKGANQTWDFSGVTRDKTDTVQHKLPSATPFAAAFSNATAGVTPDNINYGYFTNSASNYKCLGLGGDPLNTGSNLDVVFNPNFDQYRFPTQYNGKFNGNYGFTKTVPGSAVGQPTVYEVRLTYTSAYWDTIDGWGTCITPTGSYNSIRQHRKEYTYTKIEAKLLSFLPFSTVDEIYDTLNNYTWLAKESKGPLLTLGFDSIGGINRVTYSLIPPVVQAPVANFTATNPYGGFAQFTNTSTNNPTSYSWTFGDGGTSTAANPNHTYAANGTYNVCLTVTNAGGSNTICKNVTVSGIFTTTINGPNQRCSNQRSGVAYSAVIRSGNTYSWTATGGSVASGAGTAAVTVNWNANGPYNLRLIECNSTGQFCDTANVSVIILAAPTTTVTQTICFGQSFLGYSASGTYTNTYPAANGCDSVRTLVLTVRPQNTTTVNRTICAGASYLGYSSTGNYVDQYTDVNGCDSTRTLNLTVRATNNTTINTSICPGSSYYGYTTSGNYVDQFTDVNGCDSTRTLNLTVQASIIDTLNLSICNGNAYYGYTTSGSFNDTFTVAGCDSVRVLNLSVLSEIFDTVYNSICSGDSYLGYSAAGNYNDTYTSSGGCDSTRTLFLTILQPLTATVNQTICFGDTYLGYAASGNYTDTYTGSNSCDSVRTLNLTVLPQNTTSISASVCSGYDYYGHTTTGLFVDTIADVNGCDSIRTLNLVILPNNTGFINQTICAGQSYEGYTTSGVHLDTFTASNGCDSLRQITLAVLPAVTASGTVTICDGESFNGYTATGIYNDTFTVAGGCDSIYVLDLTVEPIPSAPVISASSNVLSVPSTFDGYQWYQDTTLLSGATSENYTATANGNYSVVVTNAAGCESSSAVVNVTGISVGEVSTSFGLNIYPNPTNGELVLQLSNAEQAQWQLFNSLGQLLQTDNLSHAAIINLSNLAEGVYYLKVTVGAEVVLKKVIKTN